MNPHDEAGSTGSAPATEALPDFLIIGAMRSGTTSLYRYLGAHPEIAMARKELQFFTEHFDEGLDWYRRHFPTSGTARLRGEATADYMARESAMTRIADTAPAARLIASLRNPVARAWSHYLLVRERGREPRSFARAIADELASLRQHGPDAPGVLYLPHGMYDVHVQRCRQLFPPANLHVEVFERWSNDPGPAYRRVCEFLGVDATFTPPDLGRRVNPFVTFRSLTLRRLTHRLPRPLGKALGRLNTREAHPPAIPEESRALLEDYYGPHVAKLEGILGKAIPEWHL